MAHAADFAGKRARPWSSEQLPSLSLPGKDALPRYCPTYSIDFSLEGELRCDLFRGAGPDPDAVHDRGRGGGGRGRLAHIVPPLPPSWRRHSHRDGQRSCFQAHRRWVEISIVLRISVCVRGSRSFFLQKECFFTRRRDDANLLFPGVESASGRQVSAEIFLPRQVVSRLSSAAALPPPRIEYCPRAVDALFFAAPRSSCARLIPSRPLLLGCVASSLRTASRTPATSGLSSGRQAPSDGRARSCVSKPTHLNLPPRTHA